MNWYGTAGNGGYQAAGLRAADSDAMCGDAIMYDAIAGKILTLGGAPNYQNTLATANAHIITIGDPGASVSVRQIGSMSYARSFHSSVVLPNGEYIQKLQDLSYILRTAHWFFL